MKKIFETKTTGSLRRIALPLAALTCLALSSITARASQAYGTVNNFDVVNDNGVQGHGFSAPPEIDLELVGMRGSGAEAHRAQGRPGAGIFRMVEPGGERACFRFRDRAGGP